MATPKKRGGFRENAGRKVGSNGKNDRRGVTIDDDTVDILKKFGDGNLSQGIRMAAIMIKNNNLIEDSHEDLI